MATVVWSGPALNDARRVGRTIDRHRPGSGAAWVRRVMSAADRLATMPEIGSVVEEFGVSHIRELVVAPYRIIYAVTGDTCTIAAVLHARQDLASHLDPDDLPPALPDAPT